MNTALFPEVVVNGETISRASIAAEAQFHPAPKGKPGFAWHAAARALAVRTLLVQEARRQELVAVPDDLGEGRRETDEDALIRALIEAELAGTPLDEARLHEAWVKNPAHFRSPPLWEVSHILCACDPANPVAKADALARAGSLATRLRADPGAFARLASEESDCGSGSRGGSLGQIGPGDTLPEFEAALRGLEEGQVTADPVLTRHGWHLIRLDAVAEGRELPYAAARPRLAEAMEKVNWTRVSHELVTRLIAAAEIRGVRLDFQPEGR